MVGELFKYPGDKDTYLFNLPLTTKLFLFDINNALIFDSVGKYVNNH